MAPFKITFLAALFLASGCTAPGQPKLGDTITIAPGWVRLKQSGIQAWRDPNVWATLLGAAILQVNEFDEKLSDQLRENTPLFGSTLNANDASDDFQSLTTLSYVSTALLAPGPDAPGEWLTGKAKILGAEWLTVRSAGSLTSGIKRLSRRDRPNKLNDHSFPSGHATSASTQAQMAKLNVAYLPIDSTSRRVLGLTFDSFAALTAWARVEAGMHYPADVLAGWAVGHFVANLAQVFIDPEKQRVLISAQLNQAGSAIQLILRF